MLASAPHDSMYVAVEDGPREVVVAAPCPGMDVSGLAMMISDEVIKRAAKFHRDVWRKTDNSCFIIDTQREDRKP
jgi:hypothetical protein